MRIAGAKRRQLADARKRRTRRGAPDIANRSLLIGELESRESENRSRLTRIKARPGDSRSRRKLRNERLSPRPDHSRRLPLKENKIDASIRQNPVSVHRRRGLNRLRPQTQNMFAQRHRWQKFTIVGNKPTRLRDVSRMRIAVAHRRKNTSRFGDRLGLHFAATAGTVDPLEFSEPFSSLDAWLRWMVS
jgi:hypothetical protein